MTRHPYVQAGVALGLTTAFTGALLAGGSPGHGKHVEQHPLHAPATYFANALSTGTSTAVTTSISVLDCLPFRVQYPEAIEVLVDEVSEYLPVTSVTTLRG